MVRARNAIYAHAKDILVHEELLLPILKAFPQCTSLYTLFEMIEASCVCVCVCVCARAWVAELPVTPTNTPVVPHMARRPPHGAIHAHHPGGIISWSVVCTPCIGIQFIPHREQRTFP